MCLVTSPVVAEMKLSGQNSFALPPDATNLVSGHRLDAKVLDPKNFAISTQAINFIGAQLIETMKKLGQRAGFERLIKTHVEPTSKLAYRLTGNWDVAEELVQETMLRAVRNWESFRNQSQFKTWLYRILINAFHDQNRRQNKSNLQVSDEQIESVCCEQNTSSQAEANELSNIVGQLIARLPDRQKEVLILSTYESLSNREISETLGITVANVHSNLCMARKRLKQQLGKYLKP